MCVSAPFCLCVSCLCSLFFQVFKCFRAASSKDKVRVCACTVCACACTPLQKIQYGRVSSAENGPLNSNCILLPRTLCLTLAFSMELYVKPLSPHTNTNTPACRRTHTHMNTLVEERIKGETESKSGGGVTNLLFLCLERLEEMSEGCKIILTGRIKTLIHAHRRHTNTHARTHTEVCSLLHPREMTSHIRGAGVRSSLSHIFSRTNTQICSQVPTQTNI